MKATTFPGAKRAARRAFRSRGRHRSGFIQLVAGFWSAAFRVPGVGTVVVPTLRQQEAT